VLSVLWVVNEAFNRKLMLADRLTERRMPQALQYGAIQQMLFVMGIMLGMGVMTETGVLGDVSAWIDYNIHNVWVVGLLSGMLSAIVDTFTIAISDISLYPVLTDSQTALWADSDYMSNFTVNGTYWLIVAYATAAGGCLLSVGSASGIALMKMEQVRLGWYLRHVSPKMLLGWLIGMIVLWLEIYLYN
jgi:Na+/H+ antiporter NhaD/arsenite permease-like protein